jgi:hypothetical protein
LALYWARWGVWTIIDPCELALIDGLWGIDMFSAMKVNEFGALGDLTIGTRPPLVLRLSADPVKTSELHSDGTVNFTIGHVSFFSGEAE